MNRWLGGWWIAPACVVSLMVWAFVACTAFGTTTIRKDIGGSISERAFEIEELRDSGESVRITGLCASACTMYLTLPNTCVKRHARLLFHGPQTQFYGVGLNKEDFDLWSNVVASYYPKEIKEKYLNSWRYTTIGAVEVSGSQAIQMGARDCDAD